MADESWSFGRWLKQRRQRYDLSQELLAEQIGCAPSTLQKLEQGVRRPSRTLAARIFTALAVPEAEQAPVLLLARAAAPPTDLGEQQAAPGPPVDLRHAAALVLEPAPDHLLAGIGPRLRLPALAHAPELIGREAEQADLVQRLCATPQRLVTVVGPGGVGKTSLALAVAAELVARPDTPFLASVAVVLLATAAQVADVPLAIARALGLQPTSARPVLDQLVGALRDLTLLLVLDNLEHLLNPSAGDTVVPLIDHLLGAAPGLRILATSRERLRA